MKAAKVAMWVLLAGAFAWVLVPMAAPATHVSVTPASTASHLSAMGQSTAPGCGYEHGPHGHSGTDGNADDNNGMGSDEDGDHDCTEQNPS